MFLYNLGIFFYHALIFLASPFHPKAKKMLEGRKNTFAELNKFSLNRGNSKVIWFHASSLGEFEQGRPLIEAIRKKNPEIKILLTFFSPSGFDVQKKYPLADLVTYIPFDYPGNAKKLIKTVKPDASIFIKYEYWLNFLNELHENKIPAYLVSAVFHRGQSFFKWYGGIFIRGLKTYKHIFVQDEESATLLKELNYDRYSVCGDTRYDRVLEILNHKKNIPLLENFSSGKITVVLGSSYKEEEEMIINVFSRLKKTEPNLALVIAPHEIDKENVQRIKQLLDSNNISSAVYSENVITGKDVLIFDTMGLLSSAYNYGNIAVVGGGFRDGIHNILEPAVFGLPVLFGPNFSRFNEARGLISENGAFSFGNQNELFNYLNKLLTKKELLSSASAIASAFVIKNSGATQKVLAKIEL